MPGPAKREAVRALAKRRLEKLRVKKGERREAGEADSAAIGERLATEKAMGLRRGRKKKEPVESQE